MILLNDIIYPIHTIKNIMVNRDNISFTVYFLQELKMYPITITFKTIEDLDKKVKEIVGNDKRKLLG